MTLLRAINLIKNKIKIEVRIVGRGIEENKLSQYLHKNKLNKIVKLINFKE